MARRRGGAGSSIGDDETRKTCFSEGDDERTARHACAWSRGQRTRDEAVMDVMMRMRHFGEDEGHAAGRREEVRPCELGMKRAHDEAMLEAGAWSRR